MSISKLILKTIEKRSIIRKMYEEGLKLKAKYGNENVYDLSLGNPDIRPPRQFTEALKELVNDESINHGYMPAAGYGHVRQSVADMLKAESDIEIPPDMVVMTAGAAGALNIIFKVLIDPGEQILIPSPYFPPYNNYADNANANIVFVKTNDTFHLDLDAIEKSITAATRIMLINSPNNPTGVIYSKDELKALSTVLYRANKKFGKKIYLVSDEPYSKIVYDTEVPSVFNSYRHTIMITSYSKVLSIAGERIGFIAVHPEAEDADLIVAAASVISSSIFVNAPSMFQLAVAKTQGLTVDVSIYKRRRDILCEGMAAAGYDFQVPDGAFYLFPKSPMDDDVEFARLLLNERIIVVPGTGFGKSGYFRISYAVPDETISSSLIGFTRIKKNVC